MGLFSRRSRAGTTPIGAVVEGDAAMFAWRADLRARLDGQISRATHITVAAAKSWADVRDSSPGDAYLAKALRDGGLWGSDREPGTYIARWSEDDGTVKLRAWDWDLTRPLSSGGYASMERVRTLPWPSESDQARGLGTEEDFRVFDGPSTPAAQPEEPPEELILCRESSGGGLDEDHERTLPERRGVLARIDQSRRLQLFAFVVTITATNTLLTAIFARNSLTWELELLLRIIVLIPIGYWFVKRGWLRRRIRTGATLTVGDSLTRLQRFMHGLWRFLVVALVWLVASTITHAAGAQTSLLPLGLIVTIIVASWWYGRFVNRPADP